MNYFIKQNPIQLNQSVPELNDMKIIPAHADEQITAIGNVLGNIANQYLTNKQTYNNQDLSMKMLNMEDEFQRYLKEHPTLINTEEGRQDITNRYNDYLKQKKSLLTQNKGYIGAVNYSKQVSQFLENTKSESYGLQLQLTNSFIEDESKISNSYVGQIMHTISVNNSDPNDRSNYEALSGLLAVEADRRNDLSILDKNSSFDIIRTYDSNYVQGFLNVDFQTKDFMTENGQIDLEKVQDYMGKLSDTLLNKDRIHADAKALVGRGAFGKYVSVEEAERILIDVRQIQLAGYNSKVHRAVHKINADKDAVANYDMDRYNKVIDSVSEAMSLKNRPIQVPESSLQSSPELFQGALFDSLGYQYNDKTNKLELNPHRKELMPFPFSPILASTKVDGNMDADNAYVDKNGMNYANIDNSPMYQDINDFFDKEFNHANTLNDRTTMAMSLANYATLSGQEGVQLRLTDEDRDAYTEAFRKLMQGILEGSNLTNAKEIESYKNVVREKMSNLIKYKRKALLINKIENTKITKLGDDNQDYIYKEVTGNVMSELTRPEFNLFMSCILNDEELMKQIGDYSRSNGDIIHASYQMLQQHPNNAEVYKRFTANLAMGIKDRGIRKIVQERYQMYDREYIQPIQNETLKRISQAPNTLPQSYFNLITTYSQKPDIAGNGKGVQFQEKQALQNAINLQADSVTIKNRNVQGIR